MQFDSELLRFADSLKISYVVALLNQKFVENYDNPAKAEVLTEVLNDVKLYLAPTENMEMH